MVGVFAFMRVVMTIHPTSNFDVAGYNIHHLYTGLLLLVASAIPLVLDRGEGRSRLPLNLLFGAGLGLTLDEWIYLVATDGSDMAYLTPVSFWGGALFVALAALLIVVLARRPNH